MIPLPTPENSRLRALVGSFSLAVGAVCMGFFPSTVSAAPFAETITFKQKDGQVITLWAEGDEFHAVFETLDGYTVIYDPALGSYCFAAAADGGARWASTGRAVGATGTSGASPAGLSLVKHARLSPEGRRTVAQANRARFADPVQDARWNAIKASHQSSIGPSPAPGAAPSPGPQFSPGITCTGTKVGLTLLVDFDDAPATIAQSEVDNYANSLSYTGYGNNGSIRQYFQDVSGGRLDYTQVVTVYVRIPNSLHPKSYYNDPAKDCGQMGNELIRDALAILKARPDYTSTILPTFSGLTTSGTTAIALNVFYAGANSGVWTKGLWPHKWGLYNVGAQALGNGISVHTYQVSDMGSTLKIQTFCHENGHMLCAFPDLYDYDYDSTGGAGNFCLMGYGGNNSLNPVQVCAYLKLSAGWATVTDLTSNQNVSFILGASGAEFNHFYRYRKPGTNTEYYLLENRQRTGRDTALPGGGIAIWHADELGDHNNQSLSFNTTHLNYEVSLMQADNRFDFQNYRNYGDSNDLYYPGNPSNTTARFRDDTFPNAKWWSGANSGLKLQVFGNLSNEMSVTLGDGVISAQFPLPATYSRGTLTINGTITNTLGTSISGVNVPLYLTTNLATPMVTFSRSNISSASWAFYGNIDTTIFPAGTNSVTLILSDTNTPANVTTNAFALLVDNVSPAMSAMVSNGFISSTTYLSFRATDNLSPSNLLRYFYTTNNTAATTNGILYTAPFTVSTPGLFVLRAIAMDEASNLSGEWVGTFTNDPGGSNRVAVTSMSVPGGWQRGSIPFSLVLTNRIGTGFSNNTVVYFSPTNLTRALGTLTLASNGGGSYSASGVLNTLLFPEGVTAVMVVVTDTSPVPVIRTNSNALWVDNTVPLVRMTVPAGYIRSTNQLALTATDNLTAANQMQVFFTTNGTPATAAGIPYTTPFTYPGDGILNLRAVAIDLAGNISIESNFFYTNVPDSFPLAGSGVQIGLNPGALLVAGQRIDITLGGLTSIADTTLEIYTQAGMRVRKLRELRLLPPAGATVTWDGKWENGQVETGVYLVVVKVKGAEVKGRRVVIVRGNGGL